MICWVEAAGAVGVAEAAVGVAEVLVPLAAAVLRVLRPAAVPPPHGRPQLEAGPLVLEQVDQVPELALPRGQRPVM